MDSNRINIIYDCRYPEDYERLLGEFITQGITDYRFWTCVMDKDSIVASINASHKMLVKHARDLKLPYIIIAEQDLQFTHPNSWKYFLEKKPDNYDLYLACSYIKNVNPNSEIVDNLICGFHLYIIHERYYDSFLAVPDNEHIDTAVGDLKGNFVFCKPFPALQRIGFSSNNKTIVDYNKILLPEEIYNG